MTIAIDMVEIEEIGDNPHQIAAGEDANKTHHLNGCMAEVSIRNCVLFANVDMQYVIC